jgi:uncharacterized protein
LQEFAPIKAALHGFDINLLEDIVQVYHKKHPVPFVWQLVSSQLDCDRLDYLMRDSYFTGASYGKIDLDRILMAMDYDPVSQQLVVARKGMAAIEHYLIVRYFMYAQVYNHPKNIVATWILKQAVDRAKTLLASDQLSADETVTAWLQSDRALLPLPAYLDADDGVFTYHLQRWQHHSDPVLSDLCRRYIDRDLFKALDITHLNPEQRDILLSKTRHWLTESNFEAGYYSGIRISFSRGYTLYQKGIKIQTTMGLKQISELSPLVNTLIQPYERAWLIYPREVETKLLSLVQ